VDDRRALMAAILAHPDEDTPRLALADWLQEHGDKHDQARAEFIRLQIRLANTPTGKARKPLADAADALERKHRKAWLRPLEKVDPEFLPPTYFNFRRGLFSFVSFDIGAFLLKKWQPALPDAIAAVGIEELVFYSPTKRIAEFVASEALRWTAGIHYNGADDKMLAALATAPNCAHLATLNLSEVSFTDPGLKAFATTTQTANLRKLTISTEGALTSKKAKFTAAGVLALLNSDRLPRIDHLDIDASTKKFDVRPLFADPGIGKLKSLWLSPLTRVADVVASRHLKNLTTLILNDAEMSDADAEALLASKTLAKLTELSVTVPDRLDPATEKKLEKRFGGSLMLEYDEE
jgi:uncharacterized protein (TIGR02996 family)